MKRDIKDQEDIYTKEMPAAVDFCDYVLHNYNKWLFSMFSKYIGKDVLEVGAGTGRFSNILAEQNLSKLVLLEPSLLFVTRLKSEIRRNQGSLEIIQSDALSYDKPELYGTFDSVVMVQVIEHVEDDLSVICHMTKYLKKGGYIIIQVPALKWLFGHWDKQAGHFRRYTKKDIRNFTENSGCWISEMYYFNFPGIFGWWFNFCLKKNDFGNTVDNAKLNEQGIFFDRTIVPVISLIEKFVHPPLGLGLHAILEKK